MAAGTFAVVLLEELAKPPHAVAGELAKATGRLRYDVMAAMNRDPYVPFEKLACKAAEAAVAALAAAGTRATVLSTEKLMPPARVFNVHNADVTERGLSVQTDIAGHMREMPWDEIASLAVVTLTEKETRGGASGGPSVGSQVARAAGGFLVGGPIGARLALGGGMRRKQPRATTREVQTATLALVPFSVPMELRIRQNQFNYDYLGERLTQTSGGNFRLLAGDVVSRATQARASAAARTFVETGAPPPAMESVRFSRLNRWLALRAREGL